MNPTGVQVASAPVDQTAPPAYTPSATQPTYHTSQPLQVPQYPPQPGPYQTTAYPGPAYYPPHPPVQPTVAAPVASSNVSITQTFSPTPAPVVVVESPSTRPSRDMGCPILFACLTIWLLGNYLFGLVGFILASKCDFLPGLTRVMLRFIYVIIY